MIPNSRISGLSIFLSFLSFHTPLLGARNPLVCPSNGCMKGNSDPLSHHEEPRLNHRPFTNPFPFGGRWLSRSSSYGVGISARLSLYFISPGSWIPFHPPSHAQTGQGLGRESVDGEDTRNLDSGDRKEIPGHSFYRRALKGVSVISYSSCH